MPPENVPHGKLLALDVLTPRECEIVYWVGEAKSNWEIGKIVGCAEETVKKHLQHVYQKLGVENRMQAANLYWELLRSSAEC